MNTEKIPEQPVKFRTFALVVSLLVLSAVSLACIWGPEFFVLQWGQRDSGKPSENNQPIPEAQQQVSGSGDIQSCSALGEVTITLADFSEVTVTEADGSHSGKECSYTYQVKNTGSVPVILLYFDHFYYGSNPPPNAYEFGWNKTAPLQPGKSWNLRSFLTSYPKQPLYLDMISNLAVIYDSPECAWLIADGIDPSILEIESSGDLEPPCQLVSPYGDQQAQPDLYQGLDGE